MVSEKVGGAEGTKLDDDFRDLERVRDEFFCGLKRKISNQSGPLCFFFQPVQKHVAGLQNIPSQSLHLI